MKIEMYTIPRVSLEEFADEHDLIMEVHERENPNYTNDIYYAHFKGCDVMKEGFLIGEYGHGATPEEAMESYAGKIGLKRIGLDVGTNNHKEIDVPRLYIKEKNHE